MARELGRYALLRGWNPRNAGYGVADQYMMSGKPVNPALVHPCYGSTVSHQKGFKTRLPPYVQPGDQDEHFTKDIAATVYTKPGISLDLITMTRDGRPIRLNEGQPIKAWMQTRLKAPASGRLARSG
jgi:hypothetical protein